MPFINGGHIWLVLGLIVLLVIFGPGKLPELGTAVGKTIKAFKRSTEDLKAEIALKDVEPNSAARADTVRTEPVAAAAARREAVHSEPIRAEEG